MYCKYGKRFFDMFISIIALPFFAILYIILGSLIKLEDRGPIFHKGERIGKDGAIFLMFKFRSMKVNAPDIRNQDGSTFNSSADPRLTRVGKFIRELSLDEVPQILNVLKGEMSIIGPRASLGDVLNTFKKDEIDKMKVRPGITGYTQAYFRNGLTVREKRIKDAWYANNESVWLDIRIFLKTIKTVMKREGLYTGEVVKRKSNEM